MRDLKHWLPFLNWPRPTPQLLKSEAFAGLSVGLMVIPQGVAYAALAGMPLITGMYASLIPALPTRRPFTAQASRLRYNEAM